MTVYDDVVLERHRQDEEWGGPGNDNGLHILDWFSHINKQMGYMVKEMYAAALDGASPMSLYAIRGRLIKVAALAIAAAEALDRTQGAIGNGQPRNRF